jgi:hypothetical protein
MQLSTFSEKATGVMLHTYNCTLQHRNGILFIHYCCLTCIGLAYPITIAHTAVPQNSYNTHHQTMIQNGSHTRCANDGIKKCDYCGEAWREGCTVMSPSKIQGTTVGHSLGGACGHIKAFGLSLFPHQRKFCIDGLLGRHALGMLGRTLV